MKSSRTHYGSYQIERRIGAGAMGEVYLAHDSQMNRWVALKVLGAERATDKSFVDRFIREARAAGALGHQNVVRVYGWGVDADEFFIALEYVEGGDLDHILYARRADGTRTPRFRPLPAQVSIAMARDSCLGLEHLHENGIIHRDLKPANVMLSRAGAIKITDFGLARRLDESILVSLGPTSVGTPAYMSPEAVAGQENLDWRTDVFSMGTLVYELLTSARPFPGASAQAVMYAIQAHEPPDVLGLNPLVPGPVAELVRRMLVKDRERRTVTAREARLVLDQVLAAFGILNSADVLRAFVERPREVSEGLYREMRVDNFSRGLECERQGAGRVQDAIDCYSRVLFLEPEADEARTRFERLVNESHDGTPGAPIRVPSVPPAPDRTAPLPQQPGEAATAAESETLSATMSHALGVDSSVGSGPLLPVVELPRRAPGDHGDGLRPRRLASAPSGWWAGAVLLVFVVAGLGWAAFHRRQAPEPLPQERVPDEREPRPKHDSLPDRATPAATATLRFRGNPLRALVRVDGGRTRASGSAVSVLAAGAHRISISAEGFESLNLVVELPPGGDSLVQYSLVPRSSGSPPPAAAPVDSGDVMFTLAPAAVVTVDGQLLAEGVTDGVYRLPSGHHDVRAENPDFDAKYWPNLRLGRGETVPLVWNFADAAGRLQVVVNDYVGTVVVDGRDTRLSTPVILPVRSGSHAVRLLTKPGFETSEGEVRVTVIPGHTTPVPFTIRPIR